MCAMLLSIYLRELPKLQLTKVSARASYTRPVNEMFELIAVSQFLAKQCDECQSQLVTVVYKSDQTKFKDGTEEKTGCLFCCAEFVPLVEKHRAVSTRPVQATNTRGGGRGGRGGVMVGASTRGGSSAGRGRGGRAPKDKMAQLAAYFV